MKRYIVLTLMLLSLQLSCKVFAQSQYSEILSKMENSVLGLDYGTQSDEQRINRLEEAVYGSTSKSSISTRVSKLSVDLSADVIGQKIKPKKDTFSDDEQNEVLSPREDSNVSYPMVDMLERATFRQEYKNQDITQRLSKLEQKLFKRTYSDDLNSRVERLKQAAIPNKTNIAESDDEDTYDETSDDTNSYNQSQDYLSQNRQQINPQTFGSDSGAMGSDTDIIVPLGSLEKKILRRNYPNDAVQTRLVRLEEKVFKSTFTDDDEQTRLDRIASAYQAQKSSGRYDNNRFSQHMATAMQVGAFLLMILAAVL